ncbi:MAG: TldD/PmbA family protein, partial [Candidatus Methanomethylicia archaeon]
MEEIINKALETALANGATYADVRIVEIITENITTRNAKIRNLILGRSKGIGVRALANGAWGFHSTYEITPTEAEKVAKEAVKIAKASAMVKKKPVKLAPVKPVKDSYKTPYNKDPFKVPLEEKIKLLIESDERAMTVGGEIRVASSTMQARRENKIFASTEGAYITQEITWCGASQTAIAVGYGDMQDRSFDGRNYNSGGYEIIEATELSEKSEQSAKEAIQLLQARNCPEMITNVIIGGSQLALQIHESCGHPTELDRALGAEAAYAGTSFLTPDKLGKFRYGSKIVNLVADATCPGGLGTFKYDDEGVPAQRVYLIRE